MTVQLQRLKMRVWNEFYLTADEFKDIEWCQEKSSIEYIGFSEESFSKDIEYNFKEYGLPDKVSGLINLVSSCGKYTDICVSFYLSGLTFYRDTSSPNYSSLSEDECNLLEIDNIECVFVGHELDDEKPIDAHESDAIYAFYQFKSEIYEMVTKIYFASVAFEYYFNEVDIVSE